jgi:hypothetical protein
MTEGLKQHLKEKSDWHIKNKPIAAEYFKNICQDCGTITNKKTGSIHHNQYTGHDYKKTFEKLISHNAITWLCKSCHHLRHAAFSSDEVDDRMKHSGFCAICKSFTYRIWYDRKVFFKKKGAPLCNKCIKYLFDLGILIKITGGEECSYKYSFAPALGFKNVDKKILNSIFKLLNQDKFEGKTTSICKDKQERLF